MTNREYIGEKINEWKILDFKQDEHGGKWLCECKCGEQKWQKVYNIKNGKSKMCAKCSGKSRRKPKEERKIRIRFDSNKGWEEENVFEGTYKEYLEECKKRREERKKKKDKKVAISYDRLYKIYTGIKERCYNKNSKKYKNYGGRGIIICEEWLKYKSFYEWAKSNGYKENLTIDRIDVNGNYEPQNCRWATMKEQANNKRNNFYIMYENQKYTLQELADKYKINRTTLKCRLERGIPIKIALCSNLPKEYRKHKKYEETKKYQKDRLREIRKLKKVLHKLMIKKYKERLTTK